MRYKLFKKYFQFINVRNKKIIKEARKLRVITNDIIGFDAIWNILISVSDDKVRDILILK